MKTTGNTILITGGSAGIGFAIAQVFSENGNDIIITGRNEERLQNAAAKLKNTTAIVSNVSNKEDVEKLVAKLKNDFPKLNVVINNAGRAETYNLNGEKDAYEIAEDEIVTNYLSVIGLNQKLTPLLSQQADAAIVNVSSIAVFAPNHVIATYSASKAALHSYTQSLRHTWAKSTAIKVFELMPPLVKTDFSQDIGGANGIPPKQVADDLLTAFENDKFEVHVGQTAQLYALSLQSPEQAFLAMNQEM
jgi:uncharacterized oxidoreductase